MREHHSTAMLASFIKATSDLVTIGALSDRVADTLLDVAEDNFAHLLRGEVVDGMSMVPQDTSNSCVDKFMMDVNDTVIELVNENEPGFDPSEGHGYNE